MVQQFGLRLVTVEPVCAVRIQDGGAGCITRIPRHSTFRPVRHSHLAHMIEVEWQGESYAVFEVDIQERCVPADSEGPNSMRQARIA